MIIDAISCYDGERRVMSKRGDDTFRNRLMGHTFPTPASVMQSLPSIGSVIDETYEIKSLLGKGGFGAVFLSRHIPMEREVALKLLLPQGHNPTEMVERFRREVMAIRNLSHPNTVRIFDYRDSEEDTLIYYTMEYLRGETLKDVVRGEGPQSPRRVAHIIKQILKSLAEAHSMGIVHRDLKPANIMLVEMYGEQDFVKVLDFGIAKIMEQEDDEDEPLTSAGMLVGTLRYMSPEQIKGLPLGPYTDIYALGLITLEMIIGQSVFAGTGRWEILQKQVSPDAIEFPEELYNSPIRPIMERMLAKDSAQRYPNAEVLLRDLNSIPPGALSDLPVINPRADLPPLPGNQSSSHTSRSGPSSTPSVSIDQAPTTISELNTIVPQHVPVNAQGQAMPGGPGAPTLPMPAVSAPGIPASPQPPHAFDEDSFIVATPSSKKPVLIGAGLAALLLIGGGGILFSSLNSTPAEPPALDTTAIAATSVESQGDARKALPEQPPQDKPEDNEPRDEEPTPAQPHTVQLTLDSTTAEAHAFLDGQDLGALPLSRDIATGESQTLTIKAKDFETLTLTLDESSPEMMPITLKAIEKKPRKPVESKPPRPPKETRPDKPVKPVKPVKSDPLDDWADITKKKPEKKPVKKNDKPFVPGFD